MSNRDSKVVLLKCLVETNDCPSSLTPCSYRCACSHEEYGDYCACVCNHVEEEDSCECVYKSEIMQFTVVLPDEFLEYNIGDEIINYNWNTQVYMHDNIRLSTNDNEIKTNNNLEKHVNMFTVLSAIVVDIKDSIENTNFIDLLGESIKKENVRIERTILLTDRLNKSGLEYRMDCVLCNNFIFRGSDDYSVEYIINELCKMKYLCEYCHYDDFIEQAKLTGRYDRESIKKEALNVYSKGVYPAIFPWKNSEQQEVVNTFASDRYRYDNSGTHTSTGIKSIMKYVFGTSKKSKKIKKTILKYAIGIAVISFTIHKVFYNSGIC